MAINKNVFLKLPQYEYLNLLLKKTDLKLFNAVLQK